MINLRYFLTVLLSLLISLSQLLYQLIDFLPYPIQLDQISLHQSPSQILQLIRYFRSSVLLTANLIPQHTKRSPLLRVQLLHWRGELSTRVHLLYGIEFLHFAGKFLPGTPSLHSRSTGVITVVWKTTPKRRL